MKPSTKNYESGISPSSPRNECSLGLIIATSILVIFTAGAVLHLSQNSHFTRYFTSDFYFPKIIFKTSSRNDNDYCWRTENFVRPPHDLIHNMTDEELLWRGSMVAEREGYPFPRVPKVGFLFLTRGLLPFLSLWEKFFRGHEDLYSVYVHAMPAYKLNVTKDSAFFGRQIPSKEVQWGRLSLLDAERRLLANALLDISNERFVLLSESCIPIFNFTTIYRYLVNSAHSFLDCFDEDSPDARGRYNPHMSPDINISQWRKGSAWFELNRQLATAVVADTKYYSIFNEHCNKPPCFSDEHYIPTLLNIHHPSLLANRSVTWVDWSRGGSHPARYGEESITEVFLGSIRNGTVCEYNSKPASSLCFLFARKFAPNALELLLKLSPTVMGF